MKPQENDPFSLSIKGVENLVESNVNKIDDKTNDEGVNGGLYGTLTLDLDDAELIALKKKWEDKYRSYESKIQEVFKKNRNSYLGYRSQNNWLVDGNKPTPGNMQFEAEETFLAAALAKNPEPVVFSDNTEEGNALSDGVRTMLAFHADQLVVRRKLTIMVRQWSIYQLGVLKVGWNKKINDISVENRRIENFVFDPDGYIDAYGDFSSYLGERIKTEAGALIKLYPKGKDYITLDVNGKMGTQVTYTHWYTDEYCFVTYKDKVLDKYKNELYNYDEDEEGAIKRNHFPYPKKPFIFLSVFSLQERPHDITGMIEQNIPNQDLISRRVEQIDFNISALNNAFAFSEDNFTQATAKQAANAWRKGNPILIPSGGPIDRAFVKMQVMDLPAAFFTELENNKNALKSSWGIQGIASEPNEPDQTARGLILQQSHDTTRIGGGVGDSIEQVADNLFNWFVQLYYVFYDEKHFAAIMGNAKAVEYIQLSNKDLDRQLIVSVAPDSMRPKDDISEANLAQTLFDKEAIGPKTLLKMLDFPNPDDSAEDGILYKTDPMLYIQLNFPELSAQIAQAQQQSNPVPGGNVPPQAPVPSPTLSQEPASASLNQVPI